MVEKRIHGNPIVLEGLIRVGNVFNTQRDFDQLLETIIIETIGALSADRASLFLLDEEKGEIWSKIATGLNKGEVIRLNRSEGIVGSVIESGKALNIPDAYADPRFNRKIDQITGYDTKNILCFPLTTFEGKTIGAFQVLNKNTGAFTHEDEQVLSVLASQACVAIENVQAYLASVQKHENLSSQNDLLRQQLQGKYAYPTIVGDSPPIQLVKSAIDKVSTTQANVLITGESGTGKELIARAIHSKSNRSGKSFIPLNCASLPETLLESELFGIEKGVATGVSKRIGYFELAHRGTLFLDEVGEMSMGMQAKLLRALQEQCFIRVGGNQEIQVDVRVIAATNTDLPKAIQSGDFREDLFYRLNVFPIHLPALRDRQGDLRVLASFILSNVVRKMSLGEKTFTSNSFAAMDRYNWPGNVRELENIIERAVILSEEPEVDLGPLLDGSAENAGVPQDERGPGPDAIPTGSVGGQPPQSASPVTTLDLKEAVKELEVRMIHAALVQTRGNQLKAAKKLGISREGLRKKMMRYAMLNEAGGG